MAQTTAQVSSLKMQNTRLNTLIDRWSGQFNRWLRNPWRRLSLLLISLLLGNFLATTLSTVAGQKAELDVVIAALLVLLTELISWLVYRGDRPRPADANPAGANPANPIVLDLSNGIKIGIIYGLFVEAFKLGS